MDTQQPDAVTTMANNYVTSVCNPAITYTHISSNVNKPVFHKDGYFELKSAANMRVMNPTQIPMGLSIDFPIGVIPFIQVDPSLEFDHGVYVQNYMYRNEHDGEVWLSVTAFNYAYEFAVGDVIARVFVFSSPVGALDIYEKEEETEEETGEENDPTDDPGIQ
jgi:hypothetical protein